VEKAGGEERGRLVHCAGLFEQVAGGALAEAGGEALGQAVTAGQLGQGRDDTRVQPGRPTAHPPGGQRDPGQEPVPARVRQTHLFLGNDPQAVVHSLCTLGRGGGHAAFHLGRVAPAAAQQQAGHPADGAEHRAGERATGGRRRHGHRRVQASYEATGRGYVGVRRRARTGDDRGEDRA
jgi:hypothetical protein